jgi:hypothetical protein
VEYGIREYRKYRIKVIVQQKPQSTKPWLSQFIRWIGHLYFLMRASRIDSLTGPVDLKEAAGAANGAGVDPNVLCHERFNQREPRSY